MNTPNDIVAQLLKKGQERAFLQQEWIFLKEELERQAKTSIAKIPGLYALINIGQESVKLFVYKYCDVMIMEGGGWGEVDPTDDGTHGIPLEKGPMPWAQFDVQMKLLGKALGCAEVEYSVLRKREGGIENVAALRILHPGKTITMTASGTVLYVGWDIGDDWYEATIDEEEWAFWGEGAHGSGIVRSAKKGAEEWADYEAFRASGA